MYLIFFFLLNLCLHFGCLYILGNGSSLDIIVALSCDKYIYWMYNFALQKAQQWHELDIKLLNITDDVDYDVEGM